MLNALLDGKKPRSVLMSDRDITDPGPGSEAADVVAVWGSGNSKVVPQFQATVESLVNKSIIFYGGSRSGKTTFIQDMMYITQCSFPQVIVYSSTNREQQTFDGCVPKFTIHDKIVKEQLEQMYLRQRMKTQIHKMVNDVEQLAGVFLLAATSDERAKISEVIARKNSLLRNIENTEGIRGVGKKKQVEDFVNAQLCGLMRYFISKKNWSSLLPRLSEEQRTMIEYIGINPNILVVFDDMTEDLRTFGAVCEKLAKKNGNPDDDLMSCFFTKGRWANITHWYAAHVIKKGLPKVARDNSHLCVLLTLQMATIFIGELGVTGDIKKEYMAIAAAVFKRQHHKLVYVKDIGEFYWYKANLHRPGEIKIGSKGMWDLEKKICPQNTATLDKSNPFYKTFVK